MGRIIKNIYKYVISCIYYFFFVKRHAYHILTPDETSQLIHDKGESVSRFGDGEFRVILGSGNGFQRPNERLGKRLEEVLNSDNEKLLVSIPYALKSTSLLVFKARFFWKTFLFDYGSLISKYLSPTRIYGDTNFTRFYLDHKNKKNRQKSFDLIKALWENRNVLLVEGKYTRMGVGNDIFDNVKSLRRIICPSKNAFDKYDEILESTLSHVHPGDLVLCALGMTATVLAYDLSSHGIQVLDIGHLDIEYEWMTMGAVNKVAIPNKAVNETGYTPEGELDESEYNGVIIDKIL